MNKSKLKKITPKWHAQAAAELNKDFAETALIDLDARKRRAYLGLKFIFVKARGKADGSIPHGRWDHWLTEHCPSLPRPTIGRYITEARSIAENLGWQISHFEKFETPPHLLLTTPETSLKDPQKKERQLLLDFIENPGKFQPVTEYKQAQEDAEGAIKPKRGRVKGCLGTTAEQRQAVAELEAQEAANAIRLRAEEFTAWLTGISDDQGMSALRGTREGEALMAATSYFRQTYKNVVDGEA